MKNRILIISVLLACAFSSACGAEEPNNEIKLHYYKDGYKEKCNDILERSKNNTLKEIEVGSTAGNSDKSFFVDVDNDGQDEELSHFHTRSKATYTVEIVDGTSMGLPMPGDGQGVDLDGSAFITYDGKVLLLHYVGGPFELQELREVTPQEREDRKKSLSKTYDAGRERYDVNVLCKYYAD